MQFEFDSNQAYQRDAIDAVVKLFDGQSYVETDLTFGGKYGFTAIRNHLDLDLAYIETNLRQVQEANAIAVNGLEQDDFLSFSIDMETGTGKTYIYLRTALELYQHYGMRKFIIVVPSVAIREGVLKTLQITETHFKTLYQNLPYRYCAYDSGKLSQVRQFALSGSVEFMVMTLASFNKASKNVIHNSTDRLQGETPIHLIQATQPILILDEPQRMSSERSIESLSKLAPLFALRYSATHRKPYNCVYRLTPQNALKEGLVKQIEVTGVEEDTKINRAFVQVKGIQSQRTRVTAKLAIHKLMKSGVIKQTTLTVKAGDNLADKTNLPQYEGYSVRNIDLSWGEVRFKNGVNLAQGEEHGADKESIFEMQIRHTIEAHFIKQKRLKDVNIKILSLFFIDKVDNYAREDGIIRQLFYNCFNELKQMDEYAEWKEVQPEDVQISYFAETRKSGKTLYKDSKTGEAEADQEAYELIMKEKEALLSFDQPKCFIFSHSALREGWDNPNVFQICTLNQTVSEVKKRQEIGRGVRLAVDQEGKRVHDRRYNVLTVIANDSYANYVRQLQTEVTEEFGNADSVPVPQDTRKRVKAKLRKAMLLTPEFEQLWERIKHKTRYSVAINTEKLITDVLEELDQAIIDFPSVTAETARLVVDEDDNFAAQHVGRTVVRQRSLSNTNVLRAIEHRLAHTTPAMKLTRRTLLEIIKRTRNQRSAFDNASEFAKVMVEHIKSKLARQMIDGIKYTKIGEAYEMCQFDCELQSWDEYLIPATRSVYDSVICDSDVERDFVEDLENRKDIKLYVKLPDFFTVPTPIGNYNPDWAIVKEEKDAHGRTNETVYLVRETKDTTDLSKLRPSEAQKISCGNRHFCDALGVNYSVVRSADEV